LSGQPAKWLNLLAKGTTSSDFPKLGIFLKNTHLSPSLCDNLGRKIDIERMYGSFATWANFIRTPSVRHFRVLGNTWQGLEKKNTGRCVLPTVVSFQQSPQQYLVVAPDGSRIEIPKELFGLLLDFLQGSKQTGSVVIQFRNGGIAGLEAVIKKTYK
jgi:hypothetical protein